MKNATTCATNLTKLLKKLGTAPDPHLPDADDPIAMIVLSFMLWESTTTKAMNAHGRLMDSVVDFNDLRVCMPNEAEETIGVRYPRAPERCERLRAVLKDIYNREHAVGLVRLVDQPKRDVKSYLDSLEGMVPYVATRVLLLSFGGHGIPIDGQLRDALIAAGAADESADVAELSTWLTRRVKASDGVAVHYALQAWVDKGGDKSRTKKKTAGKKTTKKTAKKAAGRNSTVRKTTKKKTASRTRAR